MDCGLKFSYTINTGPVERKCREISWTDLNGQVTQHMDCGLKFSYTINTGARVQILVKDQGLETTSTTTTATPLPTTTTTAIITTTTTTTTTQVIASTPTEFYECGLNETPGSQDPQGTCPGDQYACPDGKTCVLLCQRCDEIAQCPGGEDFDGGEEDEGSFCDQFSGDGDLVE